MRSGFKADFSGFEKFAKNFEETTKKAERIDLNELFDEDFMRKHTNHSSIHEFFKPIGFDAESEITPEFEQYVSSNTKFSSWQEMTDKAQEVFWTKNLKI